MGLLVWDGSMPIDPTPSRHRRQRSGVTVLCRYLPHHILASPRLAPDVGEAEDLGPFLRAQPHYVLVDGNLLPDHESPPSLQCSGRDSEVAVIFNDGSD
jgi:hypothetical protein